MFERFSDDFFETHFLVVGVCPQFLEEKFLIKTCTIDSQFPLFVCKVDLSHSEESSIHLVTDSEGPMETLSLTKISTWKKVPQNVRSILVSEDRPPLTFGEVTDTEITFS